MKVLLVDHHPLVQQALLRVLEELSPRVQTLSVVDRDCAIDLPETREELDLVVLCRKGLLDEPASARAPLYGGLELTERQAQVLALLVQGKPNKIISRELGLAEGTVKIHVTAILRKLKVSNRTQAALAARRLGVTAATSASHASPPHP